MMATMLHVKSQVYVIRYRDQKITSLIKRYLLLLNDLRILFKLNKAARMIGIAIIFNLTDWQNLAAKTCR